MASVSIVGGGPTGLFIAYKLVNSGIKVSLYDHSTGPGKKFLVAGNGGLNLTHSEGLDTFASRYGKDEKLFRELLEEFTPQDLRNFCHDLGVETFVGSSGRVFPKKLKAAEILLKWLNKLKSSPLFTLHLGHKLTSLSQMNEMLFEYEGKEQKVLSDFIVLALGGGSWKKTGSDGKWVGLLKDIGVGVNPLRPMNCGFECKWSDYFIKNVGRVPLKNISLKFKDVDVRGECMITEYGVEGSAVYALSGRIRDEISKKGSSEIKIDLKPDLDSDEIVERVEARNSKISMANFLRKSFNLDKKHLALLKEVSFNHPEKVIKEINLVLTEIRPIDEAISTSGGVKFSALTSGLELRSQNGVYIGGEMLDFEAPTGGYLLQGCFSTGNRIAKNIIERWEA